MKIKLSTQRQIRIQNIIFYILLLVLAVILAQVSIKTDQSYDWTNNNRHSLSDTTIQLLQQLDQPVTVEAFVSPDSQYQQAISILLSRYQRYSDNLNIVITNPDFEPEKVRELAIQQQGEMVVTLGDKKQHVYDLSEQSLTNAIITVSRHSEPWLIFIEGHGERTPLNQANFNLSVWGENLQQKGFKLQGLNLVENSQIPHNTAAVVIASPELPWLEGEINIIRDYIASGGNLVWLAEPNKSTQLESLAEQLGIAFVDGTVIDPNAELLGISDPSFALVTTYANHPIGIATTGVTLFPMATAIEQVSEQDGWHYTPLLQTQDNVWSDSDDEPVASFDQTRDTAGPLTLAYLIERELDTGEDQTIDQRIAIIGDGDFVSNTYIGNGANLELGLAVMNWVIADDELIEIPVKTTVDTTLELSPTQSLIIGLGFLIVLPLLLASIGFTLWWIRRRR